MFYNSATYREVQQDGRVALTGKDDTNFSGKKFEPTYGEVLNQSNSGERSVMVPSEAYSQNYFRAISGGSKLIQKTSDGLVLDLTGRGFGKLTFHKGSGTNVGYVNVEIPCIPSLSKISYKTEQQWGENAGGVPVYKIGDIVEGSDNDLYLVVQECRGNMLGLMVRMQPGKGDNYSYFKENEPWGPWLPNNNLSLFYQDYPGHSRHNRADIEALQSFLIFCQSPDYAQRKKQIIEATGRNVFPEVALWDGEAEFQTNGYDGFATTRQGYYHYVGDSKVKAVKIIYNCESADKTGGDTSWSVVSYFRLSPDCNSDSGITTESLFYSGEEYFKDSFYEGGSIAVYTLYIQVFSPSAWFGEKQDI